MWIERDMAVRLRSVVKQFPAVLLKGVRQCGKSSILRQTFPNATLIALDDATVCHQAQKSPEKFLDGRREPLIIDEIQQAPALAQYIKSLIDENRHIMGRFLMAGSPFSLARIPAGMLGGRSALLEVRTLSVFEIMRMPELKDTSVQYWIWRGGFPELYRNPNILAHDYYSSYTATCVDYQLGPADQDNFPDFERFLRVCAHQSGRPVAIEDFATRAEVSLERAKKWIRELEISGHITLVAAFQTSSVVKPNTSRLYFQDTGWLCYLLGLDSVESMTRSGSMKAIWETFVLNQLLHVRSIKGSSTSIRVWEDPETHEVEFMVNQQGRNKAIQATWPNVEAHVAQLLTLEQADSWLGT